MTKRLPKVFRPFFLFCLVSFSAIVIMFAAFNVVSIIRTQKKQAHLQNMALQQASRSLEEFISGAEQLSFVIQNAPQFLPHSLNANKDLPHNLVTQMQLLAPSVYSLACLGITYSDSVYGDINYKIYTNTGVYPPGYFARNICENTITENSLTELLQAQITAGFLPITQAAPRYLLYAMPIPTQYIYTPGKLLFVLNYIDFTSSLSEIAQSSDVYVLNAQKEPVLYFGQSHENIAAARLALQEPNLWNDKEIFSYAFKKYNYTVVQTFDFFTFYSPTFVALIGLALITFFVAGTASLLAYMLAQTTAKPLTALIQQTHALGYETDENNQDELTFLSSTFEQIIREQKSLSTVLENSTQLEQAQYILSLLGLGHGFDFAPQIIQRFDAEFFPHAIFGMHVLSFQFDDTRQFLEKHPAKEQWAIKLQLRQKISSHCDSFGVAAVVDLPAGQGIAVILALCVNVEESVFATLQKSLQGYCGFTLSCGVSSKVFQREELPAAYQEAVANCRYRLFLPNYTFTPQYVSTIKSQRKKLNYTEKEDLLQAIKSYHYPQIGHCIRHFFESIRAEQNLFTYKLTYFDLLSRLGKLLPQCEEKDHEKLMYLSNLLYENCYENITHVQSNFYTFCILLSDSLEAERKKQQHSDLLEVVLQYINVNYASPLLTLSSIAEDLAFSPSYLTRYFKEKTGISLMQYIDKKRLEECKELLQATQMPIKEIVAQVGYSDEANFTRKFRRCEGMTPTQYRFALQTAQRSTEPFLS